MGVRIRTPCLIRFASAMMERLVGQKNPLRYRAEIPFDGELESFSLNHPGDLMRNTLRPSDRRSLASKGVSLRALLIVSSP